MRSQRWRRGLVHIFALVKNQDSASGKFVEKSRRIHHSPAQVPAHLNGRAGTKKLEALFVEFMLFERLTQHFPSEEMGEP